jgi:hypothetical protein
MSFIGEQNMSFIGKQKEMNINQSINTEEPTKAVNYGKLSRTEQTGGLNFPSQSTNGGTLEPRSARLTCQQKVPKAYEKQSEINFLTYNYTANAWHKDFETDAAIACSEELDKCKNDSEKNLALVKYCVAKIRKLVEGTYCPPEENTATFAERIRSEVNRLFESIKSLLAGVNDDSTEKATLIEWMCKLRDRIDPDLEKYKGFFRWGLGSEVVAEVRSKYKSLNLTKKEFIALCVAEIKSMPKLENSEDIEKIVNLAFNRSEDLWQSKNFDASLAHKTTEEVNKLAYGIKDQEPISTAQETSKTEESVPIAHETNIFENIPNELETTTIPQQEPNENTLRSGMEQISSSENLTLHEPAKIVDILKFQAGKNELNQNEKNSTEKENPIEKKSLDIKKDSINKNSSHSGSESLDKFKEHLTKNTDGAAIRSLIYNFANEKLALAVEGLCEKNPSIHIEKSSLVSSLSHALADKEKMSLTRDLDGKKEHLGKIGENRWKTVDEHQQKLLKEEINEACDKFMSSEQIRKEIEEILRKISEDLKTAVRNMEKTAQK